MADYKAEWIERLTAALQAEASAGSVEIGEIDVLCETPPKDLGDLAFPMFPFARVFRKSPAAIAEAIAARLDDEQAGEAKAAGPYVNVRFPRAALSAQVLHD